MSDEPEKLEHRERKRLGPVCVVAGIFVLPVLYALSPPIVVVLFDLKVDTVFDIVYAPLVWLSLKIVFVHDFYRWYFSLFGL